MKLNIQKNYFITGASSCVWSPLVPFFVGCRHKSYETSSFGETPFFMAKDDETALAEGQVAEIVHWPNVLTSEREEGEPGTTMM